MNPIRITKFIVQVVKLVNTTSLSLVFFGFESRSGYKKYTLMSKLVKLVVLETMENYDTLPVRFRLGVLNIKIGMYFNWLEYHPDKVKVMGSSPIIPTKYGELVELVR